MRTSHNCHFVSVVVDTAGALIRKPENAIGLKEDPITLECATDSSGIAWLYDSLGIRGGECDSLDRRFTTTTVSNATHCSQLIVQGTNTTRLSGTYGCRHANVTAQAVVIIIGQYTSFTGATLCKRGIMLLTGVCQPLVIKSLTYWHPIQSNPME